MHCAGDNELGIDLVMCSDLYRNDFFVLYQKFNGQTVAESNRNGEYTLQLASQRVKPKRWMKWIYLHKLQTFFILREKFWMFSEKFLCSSYIALRKNDREVIHL